VAVRDRATGGLYWWNKRNGQVTAVGDPKPLSPALPAPASPTPWQQHQHHAAQAPLGTLVKHNLAMGLGVGAAFALIAALFR